MKRARFKHILLLFIMFFGIVANSNIYAAQNDIIVVLDPGHGGYDVGATAGGILEKDVNWKIATRVKEILDAEQGITAIMSRAENECPTLAERAKVAKDNGADLLVSFHINSSTNSIVSGSEVYITGNTNSPRFYQASNKLGQSVIANLRSVGVANHIYRPILKFSEEKRYYSDGFLADWYGIIREPMYFGIPGMIIEHCYISNPNDRRNYLNDAKINQMAEADAKAIIENKENFRINREDNSTNSEVTKLEINSTKTHLTGEAVIVDWINGMQTVPSGTPSVKLVSTDGKSSTECFVSQVRGNTYYFDVRLSALDNSKQYKVEISTTDRVNVPVNHTVNSKLGSNRGIGEDKTYYYSVKNNVINIETKQYVGDLTSEIISLNTLKVADGSYYIQGKTIVEELVDGKKDSLRELPTVKLKSTDGTIIKSCFVEQQAGNTYYFDLSIKNLDLTKQYELEISTDDENNLSENKVQNLDLSKLSETVGRCQNDKVIKIKNNKLVFEAYTYEGNLNTELKQFSVGIGTGNATYVSGEIVVVEWVNGKSTVPEVAPVMRFKSTDETVNMEVFVTATGTNTYYFDRFIEGIDTSKEYYFEVESGDKKNVSEYRKVNVYFTNSKYNNKVIGKYHEKRIRLLGQKIIFENDTYEGNLNTELKQFSVGTGNAAYVSGEIIVVEWVNGKSTVPSVAPIMRFKSTDGTVNMEVFVTATGTNTYYFDRFIEGIDTSKEYYFEIESGDKKNVSEYRKVNVYFSDSKYNNTVVGKYHDFNIRLQGQKILFEKS